MSNRKENGQLAPGDKFGDYEVIKLLGQGGMGAVYLMRAKDGVQYAVKVMDVDELDDRPEFRKRFLREAEFAIKVRHPNLIPVYCVGEDRDSGLCYLVMDYMPGGSLANRLAKCKRLSVEESVSIAGQIAAALEIVHRHGVVHRDIKPENILFDLDGTPKLSDMGVAKFSGAARRTTVTMTGMIIGTPAYMAPEQMMDSHHVDVRADIYSLGVVLYEMLAGSRPCAESTTVELLAKAIKGDPLPDVRTLRPEVSAALAYVLSLMCAPNPAERPSSPCAVVELFMKAEHGALEVPTKMLAPAAAKQKNWRKPLIAAVASVAVIAVFAAWWSTAKKVTVLAEKHEPQSAFVTNLATHVMAVTNDTTPVKTATAVEDYLDKNSRLRLQGSHGIRDGIDARSNNRQAGHPQKSLKEVEKPPSADPAATTDSKANSKSDSRHSNSSSKNRMSVGGNSSEPPTSDMPGVGGVALYGEAQSTSIKKIAVFVQNRTRVAGMDDEIDGFRDRLAAALAEIDGFAVIDSTQVADTFRRYKVTPEEEKTGLVPGIFTGGSVPRVAQMLGCNYIIAAAVVDARTISSYLNEQQIKVFTLRMSLKVMDATGASVDSVPLPAQQTPVLRADDDPMGYYQLLFEKWLDQAILVVAQKSSRWRGSTEGQGLVAFTVSTTIDRVIAALESQTKGVSGKQLQELRKVVGGATVELDGAVVGSAPGQFASTPGHHQIKVSRAWMQPFTGTINVQSGAVFEIALEMSAEGIEKWGTVEALRANVAQDYAEAAMMRGIKVNHDSSNLRDVTYGGREPVVIKQTD